MKKCIVLVMFLLSCCVFAEDSFIIKNDGSKIIIQPQSFKVDQEDKLVFYKLINSGSEKSVSFKDLDYAIFGVNKFICVTFLDTKEVKGFFVLTETKDKKLLSAVKSDEESAVIKYEFHIVDSNNSVIESHYFTNQNNATQSHLRGEIYGKIKFYFSNCYEVIKRLGMYDKTDEQFLNTTILKFFNAPIYQICK